MKVKFLLNGCLGLLTVAILTGCMSKKITSAKQTSFDAVTEKLNPGGDFYLYYNPVQVLSSLEDNIEQLHEMVLTLSSNVSAKDKANIDKGFKLGSSIIKNSGITEISGLGLSSIAINDRLYRNTIFIHHYAEDNKGIVWQLFNQSPQEQRLLKLLPTDTALAGGTDFKIKRLLDWLESEFNQVNFPQVKAKIAETRTLALKNGVDIDKLLGSFNGQYGLIITLDPDKNSKFPVQGNMLEVPRPGLALVAEVGDDYIFKVLKSKLPMAKFTLLKDGNKQLFIKLPKMLDVDLSPTVILTTDGLLIISSNFELANEIIATDKNGNGLLVTDEFKQLSQGIPLQGNGFEFISPRFSKIITDIQSQIINRALEKNRAKLGQMALNNKFNLLGSVTEVFGVTQNTPTGLLDVNNSTASQGTVFLLQATIAPTAIMAGMLLPALNAARKKARQIKNRNRIANLSGPASILNPSGSASISSLIENENNFTASQGFVMGQYLAKNNPGKVLVIAEADFKTNPYTKMLIKGLKAGIGPNADIVVDTIETSRTKQQGAKANNLMMPLMDTMTAKDFDRTAEKYPDAKVILSFVGLPRNKSRMKIWINGPKIALMNACGNLANLIKSGRICAVTISKPKADYRATYPGTPKEAFKLRYMLVTTKNIGKLKKQNPQLLSN